MVVGDGKKGVSASGGETEGDGLIEAEMLGCAAEGEAEEEGPLGPGVGDADGEAELIPADGDALGLIEGEALPAAEGLALGEVDAEGLWEGDALGDTDALGL